MVFSSAIGSFVIGESPIGVSPSPPQPPPVPNPLPVGPTQEDPADMNTYDISVTWTAPKEATIALAPSTPTTPYLRVFCTDSTTTTFNATITVGGGANLVPAFSDGTNWRVG